MENYIFCTLLNGFIARNFNNFSLLQAYIHCVKSVQIRGFSGPYFRAFGPEKTPYLDTFHAGIAQHNVDPTSLKKGDVCIYHKKHIPIIRRDYLRTSGTCV